MFGRNTSKMEDATPQKRLTCGCSFCKRSRFGSSKSNPTTYQTGSKLDFIHLRAKGLEIRSSPSCASSADQGAYPPPTDHNDAVYGPSPHFSESTPLPIPPGLL